MPTDTHHLLIRTPAPPAPFSVAGVSLTGIDGAGAADLPRLDAFCTACGFPAGWAADMLGDGCRATLAVDGATGAAMAMGWDTDRPFHVEEIGCTLHPPPGGRYLFGDFVLAAHRGRRLQRLLVHARLERMAAESAAAPAVTLVHPTNVASVRSYRGEGFAALGTFTERRWWRLRWRSAETTGRAGYRVVLRGKRVRVLSDA